MYPSLCLPGGRALLNFFLYMVDVRSESYLSVIVETKKQWVLGCHDRGDGRKSSSFYCICREKGASHFPSEIASFQVRLHSAILFTARWTANSARRRVVREASVFVLMVASVCVLTSDHKAIARMWALAISMSGYSSGTSQNDSGTKNFLILLIISQYTCFELLFAVLSIVFAHCIIIISDF